MSETITDKQCPIQFRWIIKRVLIGLLGFLPSYALIFLIFSGMLNNPYNNVKEKLVAYQFLSYAIIFIVAVFVLVIIMLILKRLTFHYAVDEKFLNADQGIIAKRKSHIPYFRIQHVIVKRDLLDKMLGLASVAVENAAQGGDGVGGLSRRYVMVGGLAGAALKKQMERQVEIIGFNGNKLGMPGLTVDHAEKVKQLLLERIQLSMMEDNTSGL